MRRRDMFTEKLWRCECGAPEFISVGHDPAGEMDPWVTIETIPPEGWWARLQACIDILRRGRTTSAELFLDPAGVEEMRDWLTAILDARPPGAGREH